MTSIVGFNARAAVATPEISPPPPTATHRQSISGCCASISSAIVPCPAITSASSYGCTIVNERVRGQSRRLGLRVVERVARQHDLRAEAARAFDLHHRA